MAGQGLIATTDEQALVAATAKTVLQILAATNVRLKMKRWKVTFDGISVTGEPIKVRLLRQTSVIGGTPTAITLVKKNTSNAEAIQASAAQYGAAPTEPIASDVIDRVDVHPQGGYEYVWPLGDEYQVPGAARLAIECTAPAAVNVIPVLEFEE